MIIVSYQNASLFLKLTSRLYVWKKKGKERKLKKNKKNKKTMLLELKKYYPIPTNHFLLIDWM